ncbi:DCN1-like protein 4 [Ananas comosus]|uniref:Defective in cullin neddylation protein n=1 Tax=Ananas comosus TaxID=4615 RepID=A0A199UPR5_ANACO|nr:DCN1-like protein 4 [Ananas comosus]
MRRSSARKTGSAAAAAAVNSSGPTKAASKEMERIDQMFYAYADTSSGMIDPEGIESFCADMEVDPTDVRILILAWKMRAQKQGYFTLEEWRTGLKALRADTISKLKKALTEVVKEVVRPSNFLDFYSYSFRYCLTEDKQKCIDIENACELLNLVLGILFRPQVEELIEYLQINFPSLDNYNPEQAWPLILDNFVEWMQAKAS